MSVEVLTSRDIQFETHCERCRAVGYIDGDKSKVCPLCDGRKMLPTCFGIALCEFIDRHKDRIGEIAERMRKVYGIPKPKV